MESIVRPDISELRINTTLCAGGDSSLYRGFDREQRPLTLKILHTDTPESLDNLDQETRILSKLEIAGVPTLLGRTKINGKTGLVYEEIKGVNLKEFLQKNIKLNASLKNTLTIILSLAKIIEQLHTNGIMHTQLNPYNVIVDPNTFDLTLVNFEKAGRHPRNVIGIGEIPTSEKEIPYIAPEQTGIKNRNVDIRTDFYSLGIIFYECLLKQTPFSSKGKNNLIKEKITNKPQAPNKIQENIPEVISSIIMKLLENDSEDRYQTDRALIQDLEKSIAGIIDETRIRPFNIAAHDIPEQFAISQKMVARENEIDTLNAAFNECVSGSQTVLFIKGGPGTGKKSLINKLLPAATQQSARLVRGEYEPLTIKTPYYGISQAFRNYFVNFFRDDEITKSEMKKKLLEIDPHQFSMLSDIIPELSDIAGKKAEVFDLSPEAAKNLLTTGFVKLLKILALKETPLVIVLENIQYTDYASLQLLKELFSKSYIKHSLWIFSFNKKGTVDSTSLKETINEIKKNNPHTKEIKLQALSITNIEILLNHSFREEVSSDDRLAQLTYRITRGNPLCVHLLLNTAAEKGCIYYDQIKKSWQINENKISSSLSSKNIIPNLEKLPADTLKTLQIASCLSREFDLDDLSESCNSTTEKTKAHLDAAISRHFIIEIARNKITSQTSISRKLKNYRFTHNKIQFAIYQSIANEKRNKIHLMLGKMLLKNNPKKKIERNVFLIVNQFNQAASFVENPKLTEKIVELNLIAAKQAIKKLAYKVAKSCLKVSTQLIEKTPKPILSSTVKSVYEQTAFCEALAGDIATANKYFIKARRHSKNILDEFSIYQAQVSLNTIRGENEKAIKIGLDYLRRCGMYIFEDVSHNDLLSSYRQTRSLYEKNGIHSLIKLPILNDPKIEAEMNMLETIFAPTVLSGNHDLVAMILSKMTELSIQYGNSNSSGFAYIYFALYVEMGFHDNHQAALQFIPVTLALNKKFKQFPPLSDLGVARLLLWKEKPASVIKYLEQSFDLAYEKGEMIYASFAKVYQVFIQYINGTHLKLIREQYIDSIEFSQAVNFTEGAYIGASLHLASISLTGAPYQLNVQEWPNNAKALKEKIENEAGPPAKAYFYLFSSESSFIMNEYYEALENLEKLQPFLALLSSQAYFLDYDFYKALSLASLYDQSGADTRKEFLFSIRRAIKLFKKFSNELSPTNYQHRYLLISAEYNRITGNNLNLTDLYDEAIALSLKQNQIHYAAIANELAGKYCLSNNKKNQATQYITNARELYSKWGALKKVSLINSQYKTLLNDMINK